MSDSHQVEQAQEAQVVQGGALFGQQLRSAREARTLTLRQAAEQTKIHPSILESLEEGRLEQRLSPVYVKSFLRQYAQFLGLDPSEAVAAYGQDRLEPQQDVSQVIGQPRAQMDIEWLPGLVFCLKIALIGVAVLACGWYFYQWGLRPVIEWRQQTSARTAAPAAQRPVETSSSTTAVNPTPLRASEESWPIPADDPLELTVQLSTAGWVRVTGDDQVVYQGVLEAGVQETWKGHERYEIVLGHPEGVQCIVNGRMIKIPRRRQGSSLTMRITRQGAEYL